jgi:integrase
LNALRLRGPRAGALIVVPAGYREEDAMASGACAIRREGKRAVVWSLKFPDANGRQVWERLGPEPQWNRHKAERELGKRLDKVERERWAKPTGETFSEFVAEWRKVWLPSRNLKKSTQLDYENTLDRHALPFFGHMLLERIGAEHVDGYVAAKRKQGLSPKTIRNHLNTLSLVFATAKRWKRVRENPLDDVDGPKAEDPETVILTEQEIARLMAVYREQAIRRCGEAEWWQLAGRMAVVVLGTALRRGELLALRWCDLDLLERRLHVRRSWVRNEMTTPKSRSSRRTVEFGAKTAAVFEEQWKTSRYRGDEDLVFGHPQLGTPLDPSELTRSYVKPALLKAKITKPLQPWHGLRHTALTMDAAVGNPNAYVQAKAGHSQFSITERYVHVAQVAFPGAVERSEERMFGAVEG